MEHEKNAGIVNINKPLGITSHDVVARVRRITGIKRVGHAGTLDPLATGVLIVLVGRQNTKRQAEFMGFPKEYEAELTFGTISDTLDAEGPLHVSATPEACAGLTAEQITDVLPQFTGTIAQRPPAHSAIKVGGTALYKKARAGTITNDDVPTREVTIDRITLLDFTPATADTAATARIKVECQKGVYIRSLARDIGDAVGTGAYMSGLVRTAIGSFRVEEALTLDDFAQTWTPPEETTD